MSICKVNFTGVRAAGNPVYVPAYIQNGTGKQIRQMATVNVYHNTGQKTDSKFKLTGWGKMADIMARSITGGKKLTVWCTANTFRGQVPTPGLQPGQPLTFVTGADGQPITVEKIGFTIEDIDFGVDSAKTITEEIQAGIRPAFWSTLGHADNVAWLALCKQRNDAQYIQGNAKFGYADVRMPNGTVIDPATIVSNRQAAANPAVNTGTAAVNTPGFQGVDPNSGQVVVNNQNMGYPANGGQPAVNAPAPANAPVATGQPAFQM